MKAVVERLKKFLEVNLTAASYLPRLQYPDSDIENLLGHYEELLKDAQELKRRVAGLEAENEMCKLIITDFEKRLDFYERDNKSQLTAARMEGFKAARKLCILNTCPDEKIIHGYAGKERGVYEVMVLNFTVCHTPDCNELGFDDWQSEREQLRRQKEFLGDGK